MAKKVKAIVKLNLPAGEATPGPPAGPILGQHGVAIMDFINQYNTATKEQKGSIIPALLTVYEDRTFTFVTKLPPVSALIKKKLGLEKGSAETKREKVGSLTQADIKEIASKKMKDLNTSNLEVAIKIITGTAKSMGVEVES
ncbi:50S ribosomal protein L11 [Candidatus Shapirobacteria bacterium]|nr:50S ribosomal protein L11 [Candidatus Shapirobacteria bacterium]